MNKMDSVIQKSKINLRFDKRIVILSLISFFLGRVSILDKLYPFGIAFLGASIILKGCNKGVLMGVITGLIAANGMAGISYYIGAIIIYVFFTYYGEKDRYSLIKASIIVGAIFTITRMAFISIQNGNYIYDLILAAFEGILIFTMTYVFSFSLPLEEFGRKEMSGEKVICSFITVALIISGLSSINIFDISIKNTISLLLVLLLSYNQGIYIGVLTGTVLGMIGYISDVQMPFIIAIYSVGGMLSGLFKELGKSGSIIGFILGNGIISYYVNGLGTSFLGYEEQLAAAILFLLLNSSAAPIINMFFKPSSKVKNEMEDRRFELVSQKLNDMAQLMNTMADTFKDTMDDSDIFSGISIYSIVDDIKSSKCDKCENCNTCWHKEYYSTYYSLYTGLGLIDSNVDNQDELIDTVIERCKDKDDLKQAMNIAYNEYQEKKKLKEKVKEQRYVLAEQIFGLSKALDSISLDIYKNAVVNTELEELLLKEIKNRRIDIKDLLVLEMPNTDIEIFMEFETNNTHERMEKIINITSASLGFPVKPDFSYGELEYNNRFRLIKTNRYDVISSGKGIANSKNEISGDSFSYGEVENMAYAVICDGMGTGKKASLDSRAAINILEKMIQANIDKDTAIKSINNILRIKGEDEMLTTLDLSFIDLYKGKLQMVKSGAEPTFIKRKDEVLVIDSLSLPIGILEDVDYSIYEESIMDGDLIIMMSDGVLEAGMKDDSMTWMKGIIESSKAGSPQDLTEEIIHAAKRENGNVIDDDMTVIVTQVFKN